MSDGRQLRERPVATSTVHHVKPASTQTQVRAPSAAAQSGTVRTRRWQSSMSTRPPTLASAATRVLGPPPNCQDMPAPPFVVVLRRHVGLRRNFALHGVCGLPGCTRRREAVTHTMELDLRRALRDKRLHNRREGGQTASAAPRAAWRPVTRPPSEVPLRSCLKRHTSGHCPSPTSPPCGYLAPPCAPVRARVTGVGGDPDPSLAWPPALYLGHCRR